MSSVPRCRARCDDVPLLVTDAELDPDMFQTEPRSSSPRAREAGKPVERVHFKGHSHISETFAVGTADRRCRSPCSNSCARQRCARPIRIEPRACGAR